MVEQELKGYTMSIKPDFDRYATARMLCAFGAIFLTTIWFVGCRDSDGPTDSQQSVPSGELQPAITLADHLAYFGFDKGKLGAITSVTFPSPVRDEKHAVFAALGSLKSLRRIVVTTDRRFNDEDIRMLGELTGLKELHLIGPQFIGDKEFEAFAALHRLQVLSISKARIINNEGWTGLEHLKELQELDLTCKTPMTSSALKSIANLPNLHSLTLTALDGMDVSGLAALSGLKKLRTLRLSGLRDGIPGAILRQFKKLEYLDELDMEGEPLAPDAMRAIADLPNLRRLAVFFGDHPSGASWSTVGPGTLEELNLYVSSDAKVKTESMRDLARLRRLELRVPAGHRVLAAVGQLEGLQEVRLDIVSGDESKGLDLLIFKGLRSLRVLTLAGCNLSGGLRLPESLGELRTLNLEDTHITDSGLLELRGMKKLQQLVVEGLRCPRWLEKNDSLQRARERSSGQVVTDAGIACLKRWPTLQELDLSWTLIGRPGLKDLEELPLLRKLNLSHTWTDDVGLRSLAKLTHLEELHIQDTEVTDAGLSLLIPLGKLRKLVVWNNRLTDVGMRQLAKIGALEELDISGTMITDVGLEHLLALKKLRKLNLSSTKITDAGLENLQELESLEELGLRRTESVTDAAVKQLRTDLPYTRVIK